jgi:hypothetical protein
MIPGARISAGSRPRQGQDAQPPHAVKVVVASLIVGTILAHFGITTDELMKTAGLSSDRVAELARAGFAWALPNLLLGALVIVPIWFLLYLFRPPGESRD